LILPSVSLRKFVLGNAVSGSQMSFVTGNTTVPYIDLFGGLIASRNLGELAHVTDTATAGFLAIDPVQTGGLALLNLLNFVLLMTATIRAVCPEF